MFQLCVAYFRLGDRRAKRDKGSNLRFLTLVDLTLVNLTYVNLT